MQSLNTLETAKLLINSFYYETTIEASLLDTVEVVNDKILKDFELAKKISFKCADFLKKEYIHKNPIYLDIERQNFYEDVKIHIQNLTIAETF